jgi:LmbE family N-acetylglucosaminyl deacetylase
VSRLFPVRMTVTAFGLAMAFSPGQLHADEVRPAFAAEPYKFVSSASQESPATLAPSGSGLRLTWSKAAPGWDTALLGVKVSGSSDDPKVTLSVGDTRIEQYLDPKASGLRWLNLTGLRDKLTDGAAVDIAAAGTTLDPAGATLRVFANKLDFKGPILIIAPHPDDAEIAAFGFYADHSANTTIVTVTSGNAGDANYEDHVKDPAKQYLLKGYLRAWDSVTIPWQGGVPPSRTYNMGYFDARLKTMRQKPAEVMPELYGPNTDLAPYRKANVATLLPNGSRQSSWNNLVADMLTLLTRVKPTTIVMPYPQLDTHADHQYATVALFDALPKWRGNPKFLLYTNHATGTENRYPYGPPGTALSLPPFAFQTLPVQGVYAHPVSADMQLKKLFALESMHDLRLSPAEQDRCGDPNAPRRPDYPRQPLVDYLRRGPRPQELFFVYDRAGVTEVLKAFLAAEGNK